MAKRVANVGGGVPTASDMFWNSPPRESAFVTTDNVSPGPVRASANGTLPPAVRCVGNVTPPSVDVYWMIEFASP